MIRITLSIIIILLVSAILIGLVRSITKNGIEVVIKKNIIPIVVICVLFIGFTSYVIIGVKNIEKKTWNYIESKGYAQQEIKSIEVNHSFLNIILSYDEWNIKVIYTDEPTSIYSYRILDGNIVEGGVSGTTDKKDLKH